MPDPQQVLLAHGGGGVLMRDLIRDRIVAQLGNPVLDRLDDGAALACPTSRVAFTSDSYVVKPIFFRGGDIGRLAVCGTVNDLAMIGGKPRWLSLSLIIEEGLPIEELDRVLASVKQAADEANVVVVTGDTKVVERGSADKLFINTAGVGELDEDVQLASANAQPGDCVIINGYLGDHGVAILSQREGIEFDTPVTSDVAPLAGLVQEMLVVTREIHCLRDPTRGGLASTLNEVASASEVGIVLYEEAIPVREEVRAACDMLGLDVLSVANEGKLLAVCPAAHAEALLAKMKQHPLGAHACIIGEVAADMPGTVLLETGIGGRRIVDVPYGEQLPRIC